MQVISFEISDWVTLETREVSTVLFEPTQTKTHLNNDNGNNDPYLHEVVLETLG